MHDAEDVVEVLERGDDLRRERREVALGDAAEGPGDVAEGAAVHELEDDGHRAVVEEGADAGDDVGRSDLMQRPELGEEVLADLRLDVHLHRLHSEMNARGGVHRALDDAAAAAADDAQDAELLQGDVEAIEGGGVVGTVDDRGVPGVRGVRAEVVAGVVAAARVRDRGLTRRARIVEAAGGTPRGVLGPARALAFAREAIVRDAKALARDLQVALRERPAVAELVARARDVRHLDRHRRTLAVERHRGAGGERADVRARGESTRGRECRTS